MSLTSGVSRVLFAEMHGCINLVNVKVVIECEGCLIYSWWWGDAIMG